MVQTYATQSLSGGLVFDFPHVFVANAVYTTPFKAGSGQNFAARIFADMTFALISL